MFKNKRLLNLLSEIFGYPKKYDHGLVELEFNCPHCDNGKNKFNLAVNTNLHKFQCWACKYRGNIWRLVGDHGTDDQKSRYKSFMFNTDDKVEEKEKEVISLSSFRSLKTEWKDSIDYKAAMRYLNSRGITKETIDKWDICYAESGKYKDRIIIPSKRLNGKTDYFVSRAFYDSVEPKYKNPDGDKSDLIFGEKFIDWTKPVFLTEGVFDALALYNAVPILGKNIRGYKRLLNKILENKTDIILCFDDDAKSDTIKIANYLKNFKIKVYILEHTKYNDVAEAFEKEGKKYIIDMIRRAKEYDELEYTVRNLL